MENRRKPREFWLYTENFKTVVEPASNIKPFVDDVVLVREVMPDEIDYKSEWLKTENELAEWKSLADGLAEALKNIGDHEGTLFGGEEALSRYQAMKKGEK